MLIFLLAFLLFFCLWLVSVVLFPFCAKMISSRWAFVVTQKQYSMFRDIKCMTFLDDGRVKKREFWRCRGPPRVQRLFSYQQHPARRGSPFLGGPNKVGQPVQPSWAKEFFTNIIKKRPKMVFLRVLGVLSPIWMRDAKPAGLGPFFMPVAPQGVSPGPFSRWLAAPPCVLKKSLVKTF